MALFLFVSSTYTRSRYVFTQKKKSLPQYVTLITIETTRFHLFFCYLDEVNMYFPIGSFRNFSLPIEDSYDINFIRTTRDRLKLVLLTPSIISVWLTKVNWKAKKKYAHIKWSIVCLANSSSWSCSKSRKFDCCLRRKSSCRMEKWYSEISNICT